MSWLKKYMDIGVEHQHAVTRNKHIRFTNSVALIICFYIIQNLALSIVFGQVLVAFIQSIHFILIALVPVFNYYGRHVLASSFFSATAIFFVTLYSIVFTLESLNFTFLPFIIFSQFFLFSPANIRYIITFVIITAICFSGIFIVEGAFDILNISIPQGLINTQRLNTLIGLPMICTAVGAYAFFTIKKAEDETAKEKEDLKATQKQLIQSEKMASLGELTAGIAHEIQNPLNFVNNFSEVNKELIGELLDEVDKGNTEEVKLIAGDIKDNSEKINHHGRRADAIVKGMLQHSRSSTGHKEPTDINALCDEYLRLSFHGLRARDNSFNATMETDFDGNIGKMNIVPQDIGRVLLNLINNAFYAVRERQKKEGEDFRPSVVVSTQSISYLQGNTHGVEITVADNGNGIPSAIREKIFQPFFTTRPTGQGTGLGLSLSYDIIKAHGGTLEILSTSDAVGTTFVIKLPV